MKIIDGKHLAEQKYAEITGINSKKLCIILASDDISSKVYVDLKLKRAKELGFEVEVKEFDISTTTTEVIDTIEKFNLNATCSGILVQLPLYVHLDEIAIINAVSKQKDVDGLSATQQGLVSQLAPNSFAPAAVLAVLESIEYAVQQNVSWECITSSTWNTAQNYFVGKTITVVNSSNLIGIPLSTILAKCGATVHICNEYTQGIKDYTTKSDIVVTATGKTNLFDHTFFKQNAIAIDITSMKINDQILGDIIYSSELESKLLAYTPVPGGIGPLTIACLLENLAST